MARSGPARWLPFIIPGALIVILLPVAVIIGLNTGEDNKTSDKAENTPAVATQVSGAITVKDFEFTPNEITTKTGATLTFQNTSQTTHKVKIGDGDAQELGPGKTITWTAKEAGTFDLVCTIHPNQMTGTVTVDEGTATSS